MYCLYAIDYFFNKKPEDIVLSLYYLESGTKLTTTRTKEQIEEVKEYLRKKAQEISLSDFKCNASRNCKDCEYRILCQTYAE